MNPEIRVWSGTSGSMGLAKTMPPFGCRNLGFRVEATLFRFRV